MKFCPGRTDVIKDDGLSDILDKDASVITNFNDLCSFMDHMDLTNEEFSVLYAAAVAIGEDQGFFARKYHGLFDQRDRGLFARRDNDTTDGQLSNIFFQRILETETPDMTELDLMFKYIVLQDF